MEWNLQVTNSLGWAFLWLGSVSRWKSARWVVSSACSIECYLPLALPCVRHESDPSLHTFTTVYDRIDVHGNVRVYALHVSLYSRCVCVCVCAQGIW